MRRVHPRAGRPTRQTRLREESPDSDADDSTSLHQIVTSNTSPTAGPSTSNVQPTPSTSTAAPDQLIATQPPTAHATQQSIKQSSGETEPRLQFSFGHEDVRRVHPRACMKTKQHEMFAKKLAPKTSPTTGHSTSKVQPIPSTSRVALNQLIATQPPVAPATPKARATQQAGKRGKGSAKKKRKSKALIEETESEKDCSRNACKKAPRIEKRKSGLLKGIIQPQPEILPGHDQITTFSELATATDVSVSDLRGVHPRAGRPTRQTRLREELPDSDADGCIPLHQIFTSTLDAMKTKQHEMFAKKLASKTSPTTGHSTSKVQPIPSTYRAALNQLIATQPPVAPATPTAHATQQAGMRGEGSLERPKRKVPLDQTESEVLCRVEPRSKRTRMDDDDQPASLPGHDQISKTVMSPFSESATATDVSVSDTPKAGKIIDERGGEIDLPDFSLRVLSSTLNKPVSISLTQMFPEKCLNALIQSAGLSHVLKAVVQLRLEPHGQHFLRPVNLLLKNVKLSGEECLLVYHKEYDENKETHWTDFTAWCSPKGTDDGVVLSLDQFSFFEIIKVIYQSVLPVMSQYVKALLNSQHSLCNFYLYYKEPDPFLSVVIETQNLDHTHSIRNRFTESEYTLVGYGCSRYTLVENEYLACYYDSQTEEAALFYLELAQCSSDGFHLNVAISVPKIKKLPKTITFRRRLFLKICDRVICEVKNTISSR